MNVSGFLNQVVSLERKTGQNEYGESTFGSAESIKARYDPNYGLRRTAMGVEIAVESYVLTEEPIALGDLIEGSEVRRVEPTVDISGETIAYEAYL